MGFTGDLESSPGRLALLRWTARLGAITAEALAIAQGTTLATARAKLRAAQRAGLLDRRRLLAQDPTLYVLSKRGMRESGLQGLGPCRISASNARHLSVCATVAGALERRFRDHRVMGERELRRDERELGRPLASAPMGQRAGGEPVLHRPDLVLWPAGCRMASVGFDQAPVVFEVELTIKASRRLMDICRAWARCRMVAGVVYIAPPDVAQALERAIARTHASEQIVVVGFDAVV